MKRLKCQCAECGKVTAARMPKLGDGYAGVDKKGTIVDRRKFPEATPIQKNSMFNTPEPKKP